jgi:hypothetical protein
VAQDNKPAPKQETEAEMERDIEAGIPASALERGLNRSRDYQLPLGGKTPGGGTIRFTFEKAYIGTWKTTSRIPLEEKGAYVKIRVSGSEKYDELRLIQVFRVITKKGPAYVSADPLFLSRRLASGWDLPADDKKNPSRGWAVDTGSQQSDAPMWVPRQLVFIGKNGKDSVFWDKPLHYNPDDLRKGKPAGEGAPLH